MQKISLSSNSSRKSLVLSQSLLKIMYRTMQKPNHPLNLHLLLLWKSITSPIRRNKHQFKKIRRVRRDNSNLLAPQIAADHWLDRSFAPSVQASTTLQQHRLVDLLSQCQLARSESGIASVQQIIKLIGQTLLSIRIRMYLLHRHPVWVELPRGSIHLLLHKVEALMHVNPSSIIHTSARLPHVKDLKTIKLLMHLPAIHHLLVPLLDPKWTSSLKDRHQRSHRILSPLLWIHLCQFKDQKVHRPKSLLAQLLKLFATQHQMIKILSRPLVWWLQSLWQLFLLGW